MAGRAGWYGPDQYTSLANPAAHFQTTGPEIWHQTEGQVTHFVASLGTCGTVTGTGTYLKGKDSAIQVIAVHPPEGHDIPGVRSRQQALVTEHFRTELYDQMVEVSNQEAFDTCRKLNQDESIAAGPSSGLNLFGALQTVPDEPGTCAVVIFCDDIFKYTGSCAKHLPDVFGEQQPKQASAETAMMTKILDTARKGQDTLAGTEAIQYIQSHNALIVDVRPAEQFQSKLRAQDSISVPLEQLLKGDMGNLPTDKEVPLLLHCNRGVASLYAMTALKAQGFVHVKHVQGGMFEWWRSGMPTDPTSNMTETGLPDAQDDEEQATVDAYKQAIE